MEKRIRRQRCQLPSCYYEGYLQKRSIKDKVARKLWTCLCGNTLFFFNEMRDADYIEKLDLSGMISVTDDNSQDHNLDAARFILRIKDRNIKFTAPSAEARELWKGYIYSVAKLFVPSSLNLLPGQVQMLKQTVELEKQRPKNIIPPAVTSCSHYVSVQADMPACYHSVSRVDAELLLEKEAERGNMLLRPGRDGNSFAVTTRQDLYGPVFRHYRVTRKHEGGFFIDVDNPVPCATLHDVINYLVEKTNGVLIPLLIEQTYEDHISYILSDVESGEMSVQQALSIVPPSVPLKPAVLRKPTPEPAPAPTVEESLCLNDMKDTGGPANSSAVPLAPLEKITPKKALMPPTAAPRKISPTPSPRNKIRKMGTHSDTT
uniref:signal-transducing adaptor protein 2-like isoform X1 n=1 Tax=Monopterus albus TaxID=43700 RepID=UPI0009B43A92|nr:signal-transducing adaptor protein 2-like isoform X1 [Monopterus albus]XP_020467951.1 signal-transducing adaptor protein 2-like isoform X1 [Monopterus albus]